MKYTETAFIRFVTAMLKRQERHNYVYILNATGIEMETFLKSLTFTYVS